MVKEHASAVLNALKRRRGAAMVEYALLAALIAIVAVVSLRTVGSNVSAKFTTVSSSV